MFPNKNWSLDGLKALIKKITTQPYSVVDYALSAQYLCYQLFFFDQRFQSVKTSVFGRKEFKQSLLPHISYFLVKI